MVTPTGGKKDVTPPRLVRAAPPDLSTNFTGKNITVTFDEYFTVNDAASQIFMSPVTEGKLKTTIKKKSLHIILPDSLKQNTTYCINFGYSITDINEGNKLNDFKYVFSTGAKIDSLVVKGKVENAFDKKTEKGILVMLFDDLSDSAVAKKKPMYYARTDDKGNFRIDHIKEGKYRLFCLKDQNFNYQYDLPNEFIAFIDSIVTVKDTSGNYTLELFQPIPEQQRLFSASLKEQGKIAFAFAKPLEDLSITLLNKNTKIAVTEFSPTRDSAFCWVDTLDTDSLFFILQDKSFTDTVGIQIKEGSKSLKDATKNKLTYGSNLSVIKKKYFITAGKPLVFSFYTPLQRIDGNKEITLTEDSTRIIVPVVTVIKTDSVTNKKAAVLTFSSNENLSYKLKIPDSTFYDIYGKTNDSISISFHTVTTGESGSLIMNILQNDSSTSYYIQFVSKTGNVTVTRPIEPGQNSLKYESILPGTYLVRAVADKNKNGKWDVGDYWKKIQPEKVILFPQEVVIRANWDVEQNFVIPK